jgi:hypothetical protein
VVRQHGRRKCERRHDEAEAREQSEHRVGRCPTAQV